MQLGKTFKVIGTLYIINSNPQEAREYLMRANGIFEAKGLLKLLKEVKNKLKMLNSSVKMTAEMAAAEALESGGDDSGKDSPERKYSSGGNKKKAGSAVGAKKKKSKKTVFRNNFIKESDSTP